MLVPEELSFPRPVALLALLTQNDGQMQILLGRKLRGFGEGQIVLPGGKIEPGESGAEAAIREFREETGLEVDPGDLEPAAQINFRFSALPVADMDCTAFIARRATGEMLVTDELEPRWTLVDQLPVEEMWQDSATWLPRLAAGEKFTATVILGSDNATVRSIEFEAWE